MQGCNLSALQDSIKKQEESDTYIVLLFSFWRTNAINPGAWGRAPCLLK